MPGKSTGKSGTVNPPKTETSKARHVHVYLPNILMKEEWTAAAKEAKMPLSKFIVETVEETLRNEGKGPRYSRIDLVNRVEGLERENEKLKDELTMKSRAYKTLDQEIRGLRLHVFQHPEESGLKKLDKDLIELFKEKKKLTYNEILPTLGIKPTEMDLVTSLQNELKLMMEFGLIKAMYRGWRWVG